MKVKELIEMLSEVDGDIEVFLPGADVFDGILKEPCSEETGATEIADIPANQMEEYMNTNPEFIDEGLFPKKKVFLIAHHGYSEHPEGIPPELN